eukprot:1719143-Prymnesium_polylepis.1
MHRNNKSVRSVWTVWPTRDAPWCCRRKSQGCVTRLKVGSRHVANMSNVTIDWTIPPSLVPELS